MTKMIKIAGPRPGCDPKVVSYRMSRIKGKNTGIELTLRRALWRAGLRYRLHSKGLPGTPDLVFAKARVAVFCDSSFWHGRDWERTKRRLARNRRFWILKIERNMRRDARVSVELRSMGWQVLRFWDIEIEHDLANCLRTVVRALQ